METGGVENIEANETGGVLRSLGYEVVHNLGAGGFGMVKLATSERHRKHVAIKIMDRRKESSDFAWKQLPRELAILKRVRHPHIIQVHESFDMPNGQVFIVMEVAATDLLHEIMALHHVPVNQARMWFSQLVGAVGYLHQQDIAHRDLKCENVLLSADGQVKLTDFGLGCFVRGYPSLSQTYCGTLHYCAPEVLLNRPYDPLKSDVWSLGVILYVMVTGFMPFRTDHQGSLTQLQRKAVEYPCGVAVEEPCRAFISYMLRFNPFTRPSVRNVENHPWLQARQEQ
ncbi:testis-specific serine/threonine-protein kinase 6-like [Salminus brasiliensis]|uniref:testis-specific serine/threonine-protein kinase 6-like n=1 Tax=Salminus brasiliensis TaxID=930266 RepID=UPI003B835D35